MASSRASLFPCSESHECSTDIPKRWCWEWEERGYPWSLQVLGKSGRVPTPPIADTVSSRAAQNLSEDHGDQWLTALIGRMGGFACEHLWDPLWELPGILRRILLGTGNLWPCTNRWVQRQGKFEWLLFLSLHPYLQVAKEKASEQRESLGGPLGRESA